MALYFGVIKNNEFRDSFRYCLLSMHSDIGSSLLRLNQQPFHCSLIVKCRDNCISSAIYQM